jgi:hypothetical protein
MAFRFLAIKRAAMSKKPVIPPRGLNINQASAYWGVSPGTFKKLVRLGFAPAPMKLPGIERNIFDKIALDRAMDAGSGGSLQKPLADHERPPF